MAGGWNKLRPKVPSSETSNPRRAAAEGSKGLSPRGRCRSWRRNSRFPQATGATGRYHPGGRWPLLREVSCSDQFPLRSHHACNRSTPSFAVLLWGAPLTSSREPPHQASSALSDEELVAAALAAAPERRQELLDDLYRRYSRKVALWCYRICGDADRAADATQEVFLRLHSRIHLFRGESLFSTWLYTLTRRTTLTFLTRGQGSRPAAESLEALAPADTPAVEASEERLGEVDLQRRLGAALRQDLSSQEALVVRLHYDMGMTLPAITELLELENRSGAKALLVAAKRRLRARFAREIEELHGPSSE